MDEPTTYLRLVTLSSNLKRETTDTNSSFSNSIANDSRRLRKVTLKEFIVRGKLDRIGIYSISIFIELKFRTPNGDVYVAEEKNTYFKATYDSRTGMSSVIDTPIRFDAPSCPVAEVTLKDIQGRVIGGFAEVELTFELETSSR